MKKIELLFAAIIAVGVIAFVGVFFSGSISTDYHGSNDIESYSLELTKNDFVLTHEKYESNSYVTHIEVYAGIEDKGRFYVNSYTEKVQIFGTLVSEKTVSGMNTNLRDYLYMLSYNSGYIINDVPVTVYDATYSYKLADVTTADNYENHGEYTKVIRGSTKADIAALGIVEVYSDGSAIKYEVSEDRVGDVDLTTCGVKNVIIHYGEDSFANIPIEVVDFKCTCDVVISGMTLSEAVESGRVTFTPSDVVITADKWDSSEGARMMTFTSESGYSTECFIEFVSMDNKDVDSFTTYDFKQYIEKGSAMPAFTFDMTLKNGIEYEDISSTEAIVSGYDRNKLGAQVITVIYDKCAFNVAMYVYDKEQSIPVSASLINGTFTPSLSDGKLLYDRSGLDFSEYSIKVMLTNGSVRYIPLERSMISTPYGAWIYSGFTGDIPGTVHLNIDGFRYYEDILITYDPLENNIKESLSFENIMSKCETVMCTFGMSSGSEIYYTMGLGKNGFYIAYDKGEYSYFTDKYLEYSCIGATDYYKFYLGTETREFDLTGSLIKDAVMTGKTHTSSGVYIASFHMIVSEELASKLLDLGFTVGEEIDFDVIYDSASNIISSIDMKTEHDIDWITLSYNPENPHYSTHVYNLINKVGAVTLTVKYPDGTSTVKNVLYGAKEIVFVCDEGCGLYTNAEGTRPFVISVTGITASKTVYYL